jgi:hypothetical protein
MRTDKYGNKHELAKDIKSDIDLALSDYQGDDEVEEIQDFLKGEYFACLVENIVSTVEQHLAYQVKTLGEVVTEETLR